MNIGNKNSVFINTILLIASMHWACVILATLLEHIFSEFIEFDYLPWVRLFVLIVALALLIPYIRRAVVLTKVEPKVLLRTLLITFLLFIIAQFHYLYDYTPRFCGNAILEDSLSVLDFQEVNIRNENYVRYIEMVLLSLYIFWFSRMRIKRSKES